MGSNVEKKKEIDRVWREENRENNILYDREYSLIEMWCAVSECKVRKCKWRRYIESRKRRMGGEWG